MDEIAALDAESVDALENIKALLPKNVWPMKVLGDVCENLPIASEPKRNKRSSGPYPYSELPVS